MTIEICRLNPSDWVEYKQMRLRALKENPEAFGKSYDEEVKFGQDIWQQRLNNAKVFAAKKNNKLVGLVVLSYSKEDVNTANIGSMWVDSNNRNSGVGSLLIEQLISEAKKDQALKISGGCMKNNPVALDFYLKRGFVLTGVELPIEKDPELCELEICYSFESVN